MNKLKKNSKISKILFPIKNIYFFQDLFKQKFTNKLFFFVYEITINIYQKFQIFLYSFPNIFLC